ncbi:MAG: hypothetical protein OEU95_09490 [Nitrospirota bacterium]|nr:hypothetical protein [Nitrospirota bacterium]
MLKKLLKYSCFSLVLLIAACAPRPSIVAPPVYKGMELSLTDVIAKAGGDTEAIKAIADITIEKNGEPYDSVNASALIKRPGMVHMRIYKFGILARDFIVKGREMHVLSGGNSDNLKQLGKDFYNAVFWWEDMTDAVMSGKGSEYIIRAKNKEIHLDRATLMPVRQVLAAMDKEMEITYDAPQRSEDGSWYPSTIRIHLNDFRFTIRIKKLLRNPSMGGADFKVPAEG